MTPDVSAKLTKARRRIVLARQLVADGSHDFAISAAYFAMFHVAEAMLATCGERYRKHSAVASAFGKRFARSGEVPEELHGYLLTAQRMRNASDYDSLAVFAVDEASEMIRRAELFLSAGESWILLQPPLPF